MADQQPRLRRATPHPVVSVVVPTYDRPASLPAAVQSVVDQTFGAWELIVVDDASTVDVSAPMRPFLDDHRIQLVHRPDNGGVSAARNTGLARAAGRFVCFLDDDDTYLPGKLAHQVTKLVRAPANVGAVGGCLVLKTGEARCRGRFELRRDDLMRWDRSNLQIGALLFRRSAAAATWFDERLNAVEDWDLQVRLLERHRILVDDVPVARWQSPGGARLTADPSTAACWETVYDKYLPEIRRDRHGHAKWHKRMALNYLQFGDTRAARLHFGAAASLVPWDPRAWALLATTAFGPDRRRRAVQLYKSLARHREDIARRLRGSSDAG
jgi:glycosyltransferase involved in cell wall biosynthesis